MVATTSSLNASPLASADRIDQFLQTLTEQSIKYVRFEMPDLHGVSRLKIVPIDKVESYTHKRSCYRSGTTGIHGSVLNAYIENSGGN